MISPPPESLRLPGTYKGTRRRREPPIVAECACGWRSKPSNPKRAEKRFAAHVARVQLGIAALTSEPLPRPTQILTSSGSFQTSRTRLFGRNQLNQFSLPFLLRRDGIGVSFLKS